jgi:hypothetical protein
MAVKGIFVSDAGALQERSDGLSSVILKEGRGSSVPLFALSSGMANDTASSTVVSWYEEGIWASRTVISAINSALGNLITVEDASWLHENMVMMVESTGEYVFITSVNGNVLTVIRGYGSTTAANITLGGDEQALQFVTTAFEEASERPTAIATSPYPRTNITQIFRRSWDISGTAQATTYRFGDRTARNKGDASMNLALDIERALIWGKMHTGVINNKPFRAMDGFLAQLRSNIFQAPTGGLTRRVLDDFAERVFSKNIQGRPNERLVFVGNVALRAMNEIVLRHSSYNIALRENAFGIKVNTFVTPFGDLTLMPHPLMNDSPVWSSEIYALHPAAMSISWLRRVFHIDEGQNGQSSELRDAKAGVFTAEGTCKYALESTGAIMTGVEVDYYDPS